MQNGEMLSGHLPQSTLHVGHQKRNASSFLRRWNSCVTSLGRTHMLCEIYHDIPQKEDLRRRTVGRRLLHPRSSAGSHVHHSSRCHCLQERMNQCMFQLFHWGVTHIIILDQRMTYKTLTQCRRPLPASFFCFPPNESITKVFCAVLCRVSTCTKAYCPGRKRTLFSSECSAAR